MIIARDKAKLEHMRYLSTQSKNDTLRFIHDEVGYNYRLTNIQAALGIAQLNELGKFLIKKKHNYELYKKLGVPLIPFCENVHPNYWFYSFLSDGKRDLIIAELERRGIQSRPIWELMHNLKPYKNCRAYKIEKATYYHDNVVNLPCSTNLSDADVRRVAAELLDIIK